MKINTHITLPIGVKQGAEGSIFTPVPHTVLGSEAEQVTF